MALCHLMVKSLPLCCNLDAVAVHHRLDSVPDLATFVTITNSTHRQHALGVYVSISTLPHAHLAHS